MTSRAFVFLAAALAFLGSAAAQEAPSTGGALIGRLLDGAGLRAAPPPPAEFVRNSRPERLDYIPLSPAPEPGKKKSVAEMQTLGAELDRAIATNRRKAARVKLPDAATPSSRSR